MSSHQDRANTLIRQANEARENGQIDEAIRSYKDAIALVPAYSSFNLIIADMLLEMRRYGEAIETYKQTLADHPDHEQAWVGLGKCLLLLEDHEAATTTFQSALDANKNNAEASYYMALLLGLQGNFKDAESLLYIALKHNPGWEAQARKEASLKPVFESSRRLNNIAREKKWWEVWK
jgi:tetratricopeptide (TPR) repeat protein